MYSAEGCPFTLEKRIVFNGQGAASREFGNVYDMDVFAVVIAIDRTDLRFEIVDELFIQIDLEIQVAGCKSEVCSVECGPLDLS